MPEYVDAEELLGDARRKQRRAEEVARRAHAKLGVRRATRREVSLSAEQRAAVDRARQGPLGWLFEGSSDADVVRDSTSLKKIMRIYRARPRMRNASARTTIHLPSGKSVRFHSASGEVTRP
jgi:hypothetical protein